MKEKKDPAKKLLNKNLAMYLQDVFTEQEKLYLLVDKQNAEIAELKKAVLALVAAQTDLKTFEKKIFGQNFIKNKDVPYTE